MRATLSRTLRHLLPAALAFATATCTQDNTGPSDTGRGYFSFRPVYHLAGGASLSQFGIVADTIRVRITRPVDVLVIDTAVVFPADSSSLSLALPITLLTSPELLDAVVTISAQGAVIFVDSLQVEAVDGPPGSSTPPTIVFDYVGPGSNIAKIDLVPADTTITFGDTVFFSATAEDSAQAPVSNFYVSWTSTDSNVAKVNGAGRVVAGIARGTAKIIGMTPTGIADTSSITIAPSPVIITADSGNAQVAPAGDSLPALFVARVKAADSAGVAGIPVRFAAVLGNGKIRDTLLYTDANGRVRTRAVFDTAAGAYSWTATAVGTGLPAATFTATATAGAATSIAVQSGNAQVDTISQVLSAPFVVRITDAFGNPVTGAGVLFTRTVGTGTLADDTVFTNGSGLASVGYTLGGTIGTDSVKALLVGTSAFVSFTATGVADGPATIQEFDGSGQSIMVNSAFPESLLVRVFDAHDNPVTGAKVVWSIFSGQGMLLFDTTTTDTTGSTRNGLIAGTLAGPLQVEVRPVALVNGITMTNTVLPGPAMQLTIGAGNGQSGNAGTALPIAPTVHVLDAFNNVVAGTTIDFAVTAGGGTIDSATATSDSAGNANAGVWTLGSTPGGNQVRATSAAVPADTLLFDATGIPSGTSKVWTGASTNSWNDAASWSPAGAPGITDNIFVPASAPSPVLGTSTTISGLTIEAGATLTSNALLTVSADADINGTLNGTGTLALSGSGGTFHGTIQSPIVNISGNHSLSGATTMSGALNVTSGSFSVNGQALTVGGNLTVSGGQLGMGSGTDSVDVAGNFTISTGTTGTGGLTSGVMVLRGNFTQTAGSTTNFAPSGSHKVRFLGSGVQTVSFANPGSAASRFQEVEFGSAAGTTLNSTFTAMGIVTANAGTVTGIGWTANIGGGLVTQYATWQVSTTLWGQDPTVYPDSLPRNVTAFNAWTLTKSFKADSNFVVNNTGVVNLNGHTLRIGGTVTQGGVLRMQNTGDTLDVGKMFTVNGGTTGAGDLTGGMLRLHGGFTQNIGSTSNFQASGSHVTRFEGLTGQSATFSSAGSTGSRFQNVEFADSVNFSGTLYVAGDVSMLTGGKAQSTSTATLAGNLSDPTNLGWRYATTQLTGTPSLLPDSMVTNLSVQGPWTLARRTRITGTLALTSGGTLDLNGDTLLVLGAMTQGGILLSDSASALLDVGGAFTVNSGTSGSGALSAGHLVLHQGFTQNIGSTTNFVAGAGFLTTFAGTGGHTMSFSSGSVGSSTFSALEVFDSLTVSGTFATTGDITIMPAGRMVGASTGTLLGGLVDSSGLGYRMASTTIPGGQVIPSAMTTNLSLTGAWDLPASFTLTGNLSLGSGANLNTSGHRLYVSGSMVQGGILRMLLPADTVEVNGLLTVNSTTAGGGHLTNGRLLLHNGLTQNIGHTNNFTPSGAHVTEFAGSGGHALSVSSFSAANSHFQGLIVRDSLSVSGNIAALGTVTLDPTGRLVGPGIGILDGDLVDSTYRGWRMATTNVTGTQKSLPDTMTTNLVLQDTLYVANGAQRQVTGNVTISSSGMLHFAGFAGTLSIVGDVTQSGYLSMQGAANFLNIHGDLTVNSALTSNLFNGRITIDGDFQQLLGAGGNYAPSGPLLTYFPATGPHAVSFSDPVNSYFSGLSVNGSTVTLGSNVVAGTFAAHGGAILTSPAAQRLLRVIDLSVDGATFDRVRLQAHQFDSIPTFNNVTFLNQGAGTYQLSLETPGATGDTLRFTNVTFDTPVFTTGGYLLVTDSTANDAPAVIGFYNSNPLNGSLNTTIGASPGDTPVVLWTHLDWVTQPVDGIELIPLLTAPQVAVLDPSGNIETGYTNTITLLLGNDPSGGAAVLGGNTADPSSGVATFDSLSVSLAGALYTLRPSSPELGLGPESSPFTISIPLPSGTTTAFNNGGGDNDWSNTSNWTSGVPDSTDNVYIQPGQSATVNTPSRANTVIIGTGGTILLNADLVVDSTVTAGTTITGGGRLIAQGTGYLSGTVGDLVVTGDYTVPSSDPLVAAGITITGATATLDPGQGQITAYDSLVTVAGGRLNIGYPGASVDVDGHVRFAGGASSLTDGTLYIGGDFFQDTIPGAFSAGPGLQVNFDGGGVQTAAFSTPDSIGDHFGNVGITGGGTLHLAGFVPILGDLDISGGTVIVDSVTFIGGGVSGATGAFLQGNTLQVAGDLGMGGVYSMAQTVFVGTGQTIHPLSSGYDTLSVMGTAVLGGGITANAVFVFGDGQLSMGGFRMDVAGDFGTFGNGIFGMQDARDSLMVAGTFYATGGPTTGTLTAGLLQVAGNFIQGNYVPCCVEVIQTGPMPAGNSFDAAPGMKVRLTGGTGNRIVYFANPVQPPGSGSITAGGTSKFGDLELVDGVDTLLSVVPVAGTTVMAGGELYDGTLATAGPFTVLPGISQLNLSSLYSGGGIDYQASGATYNVAETFFFGGDSIPVLPYQWLRVGFTGMALTGDVSASQVTLGGQGEGPSDSYNGDLDLNGHKLTVSGGLYLSGFGRFRMVSPADSLDVTGTMNLAGGDMTGMVTDGVITARGGVYINPNYSDTSFVAAGNNLFVMDAGGPTDLWISQSPGDPLRFADFGVASGTTVNFNPYSTGALVVSDSLGISGFLLQAAATRKVIALGKLYVGVSLGITVDTVEVHDELEVSAAGYSVQVTRFAGTGQQIFPGINYADVEVTGTVSLGNNVSVPGNFTVRGGTFDLGGHKLIVGKSTSILEDGLLVMSAPADTISIAEGITFDGRDSEGSLTDGVIETNYFTQAATTSDRSFRSSGNHRVVMTGVDPFDSGNNITMATGSAAQSRFNKLFLDSGGTPNSSTNVLGHVEVRDSMVIQPGSTFAVNSGQEFSGIHVAGAFVVPGMVQVFVDTVDLSGPIAVATGVFNGNTVRFSGVAQAIPDTQSYNRIEVTGTAAPEGLENITAGDVAILGTGRLTIGAGQRVIAGGDFSTAEGGTLQMNGAGADLVISGNATFGGGSASGLLTDGTVRVAGSFTTVGANSNDPFDALNTGVTFQGNSGQQLVNLDPATSGNFRSVGITNPNGIMISGLMIVTDSVGTAGPVEGDSLYQFGNFFMNSGAQVTVHTLKTAGLFVGSPESYNVRRTHIVNPNGLPSVSFDTLVINSLGVSAYSPISANVLYVAGNGSAFSGVGGQASLDLGIYGASVNHSINGDVHVEGSDATLLVAEDTVNVSGDLYTSLGGTVQMNGPGALVVSGTTLFGGGSQEGLMTAGTLRVFGGITQQAFSSPSSFRLDGTVLDLPAGPSHVLNFETPDSSWFPGISNGGVGDLNLLIVGRIVVAGGGLSGNGLTISGDTLENFGPLDAGSSQINLDLKKYVGSLFDQFASVGSWNVTTTQFITGGNLPYDNLFTFDTLIVSEYLGGELSQLIKASYVEVTGPGNPRHIGDGKGRLYLDGGDGNTHLDVAGDVVVRGDGATIESNAGLLTATGDLIVDQGAYLRSMGSFGGADWGVDGNVIFDGASTRDSLTIGHLTIGKDFIQKGTTSGESFAASPGFVTEFVGAGTHAIDFETPTVAGGGGSYFGSLAFEPIDDIVVKTATDLFVEGTLTTAGYTNLVLINTAPVLRTLTAREASIQGITFDHLQFHLENTVTPSVANFDIVKFQNFLTSEDQFLVTLPGQASSAYSWSNFTFTQLDLGGADTGHYVVGTDTDGAFPFLGVNIGTNQGTSGELGYFVGLNGANVGPFAP